MIGHLVHRAQREQRALTLDEFSTFCSDQATRVRQSLQTRRDPIDPSIHIGAYGRPVLAPDLYTMTVQA